MNRQLRKQIIELLTPLPCMATEKSRQSVLIAAGLGAIKAQTDISGDARQAVIWLVDALEQYGLLEGEPALVAFLREVATQVGEDKQQQIQGFCERVLHDSREKNAYEMQRLTIYVDACPPEPEPEPVSADVGPNPYKGLSAFQESDADRFFGRERVSQTLWERFCALHERPLDGPAPLRLLAILGPSGSGKSSVARAGLLPKLDAQPLPGKQRARVAVFTPGTHPLEALALMLARIDPSPRTLAAKTSELTEMLKQETDEQWEGLRRIADTLPDIDTQPLILLLDQFEEVYAKEVKPEERRKFLDNLLCAAADPSGHLSVILTLRSDFLGQTQRHPIFNQAIADNEVLIPVMNEAELREAIARPAENAGHALDEACVDLLIEQTRDREGALPLLQFALTRIWDGLADGVQPADTLKQIGGVGGALAGEAQRLYEKLSDPDKIIARRAFLALVQLGEGTRDTRRRISLSEVVAHGEEPAHVQTVIRCFADPHARLVTLSATPEGTETAEVTHEALLDHWDTLKEWLDANREDLRFHRHLAQDAAYWEKQSKPDGKLWRSPDLDLLQQYHQRAGADMTPLQVEFFEESVRKERHSKRVRRIAVAAIVVLAVLMSVAAGVALWAYNQATEQTAEAEKQTIEAVHQSRVSLIRSLVAYALHEDALASRKLADAPASRERAALLARQASILNQRFDGGVDKQIDDALQMIFRTAAIQEGPGSDATGSDLFDLVCTSVHVTRVLTPEEWERYVGTAVEQEPACPGMPDVLSLRREAMITGEVEALSLNVRETGGSYFTLAGSPIEYIDNEFEDRGEVVFDDATGLLWQKSGSKEPLPYAEAQRHIEQLNQQKFAGYDDWRLPTVEELLSLVEEEKHEVFRLTEQSFSALLEKEVPEEVRTALQPLQDEQFIDEDTFLRAIRERIRAEQSDETIHRILNSARDRLYIDPIFDYRQGWCWSADTYQIKDESSSESAWLVGFNYGSVLWYGLLSLDYVRAVRSWQ